MLDNAQEISSLLKGSFLENRQIKTLAIPQSPQVALTMAISQAESLAAWQLLRSLVSQTQRYPVIIINWSDDDYFSRFYYQEEQVIGKIVSTSPEAIISQVSDIDIAAFLEQQSQELFPQYLEDALEYSLELIKKQFGTSPKISEVKKLVDNQIIKSELELETWLEQWERENFPEAKASNLIDTIYLDWFEHNDSLDLILLPTSNGWESLAYIHWFGASTVGTPLVMALLKKWYHQYQAELVCHYGTMLQMSVGRSPDNLEEAFNLAWEQFAIAPCTLLLPGVRLREHACALLAVQRWFLHERP
jgi:hypothetical protein